MSSRKDRYNTVLKTGDYVYHIRYQARGMVVDTEDRHEMNIIKVKFAKDNQIVFCCNLIKMPSSSISINNFLQKYYPELLM